jgi:hypothetical protein
MHAMRDHLLPLAWGFGGALAAILLAALLYHAYQDHKFLHDLANALAAQQQAVQPSAVKPPLPPSQK